MPTRHLSTAHYYYQAIPSVSKTNTAPPSINNQRGYLLYNEQS